MTELRVDPAIHGEDALRMLREYGAPPPYAGPEGERIVTCESVMVFNNAKPQTLHGRLVGFSDGGPHTICAVFTLMGAESSRRTAEWSGSGWDWFREAEAPASARTRLVLISPTGEQVEARCDRCRFWGTMVLLGDKRPCGAMFHAQHPDTVRNEKEQRCFIAPYFSEGLVEHLFEKYTPAGYGCAMFEASP